MKIGDWGFKMVAVDDFSAEYITAKALAKGHPPEAVIHDLVCNGV
jgi:hypothetical protein